MPRYSSFQVKSSSILDNSPPLSNVNKLKATGSKNYSTLSNDLKISWDGDLKIDPNTGDYSVSYDLEAFTQRLYRLMITQAGTVPGNPSFGWDFEYIFSLPYDQQVQNLPYIAKSIKQVLEADSEISYVDDVSVSIERIDYQTHKINIEIQVIPVGYNSQVNLTLESV